MAFLHQPAVIRKAGDGIFTPTNSHAKSGRWHFHTNQESGSGRKMAFLHQPGVRLKAEDGIFTSTRSQAQGGRWYFYINQESGSRRKMIFLHQPGVRLKADILGTCSPCVSSILTAEHPSLTLPPFPQKENKVQFLTFNVP